MEELSIEEKARRYDVARKVAKSNYETIVQMDKDYTFAKEWIVNTFHHMFPELKESEDESIRKWLIDMVEEIRKADPTNADHNGNCSRAIAWLEKQGKSNMGISEATKRELEDNLNKALQKETPESCNEFLEKQGKQNPIFRVGDYIKNMKTGDKVLIEQLDLEIKAYCCVSYDGTAIIHFDFPFSQQDEWKLIGQKIIEQKSAENIEKIETAIHLACKFIRHHSRKGDSINGIDCTELVKILESFKDRVLLHSRQGWSEEDETKIKSIIILLKSPTLCAMEGNKGIIAANIKYLNSLKERIGNFNDGYKVGFSEAKYNQWKPSDEQITWLYRATDEAKKDSRMKQVLNELLFELKKLREE